MALILTSAQMGRSDRWAVDVMGVPGVVLMENAGRGVARLVLRHLAAAGTPVEDARVKVVVGAGQNGGDGFVIARHLALSGARVEIIAALPPGRLMGDAALNAQVVASMPAIERTDASAVTEVAAWSAQLTGAHILVDAIFGTGLRADVHGVPAAAIAAMNASSAWKVAVDLPSGLDADTGAVRGIAVRADVTGTMAARKVGLVVNAEAPVGKVQIVRLGVPLFAPPEDGPYVHDIEDDWIRRQVPELGPAAHKGTRGHLLVVAGSPGKTGAAVLAARAAMRAGAGLVTVASTLAGQVALDAKLVEAMSAVYHHGDEPDESAHDHIARLAAGKKAIVLGPGIPGGAGMRAVVQRLAAALPLPMVLDADGLNHLGGDPGVVAHAPAARVLTPHPGEAARLLALSIEVVQGDRMAAVRRLSSMTGAVVVLKGARSLVGEPDGTVHVNPTADAALATAGSGDVLTGTIGALLAQGLSARDAALVGVYVHGHAADEAARVLGTRALVAGDLPEAIARVMRPA
jgi:NAD(P)H-hydrate epimerase